MTFRIRNSNEPLNTFEAKAHVIITMKTRDIATRFSLLTTVTNIWFLFFANNPNAKNKKYFDMCS